MRKVKGTSLRRTRRRKKLKIGIKIWQKEYLTDKGESIIKAADQPTLKLGQRLKGEMRKSTCSYDGKLRDSHEHTH